VFDKKKLITFSVLFLGNPSYLIDVIGFVENAEQYNANYVLVISHFVVIGYLSYQIFTEIPGFSLKFLEFPNPLYKSSLFFISETPSIFRKNSESQDTICT
jgi:hypothetical protein